MATIGEKLVVVVVVVDVATESTRSKGIRGKKMVDGKIETEEEESGGKKGERRGGTLLS